jgi:hypothetical protein
MHEFHKHSIEEHKSDLEGKKAAVIHSYQNKTISGDRNPNRGYMGANDWRGA